MEKYLNLVASGKLDPTKIVTHRFNGLDAVEECMLLMKDKPSDFIKPVVFID